MTIQNIERPEGTYTAEYAKSRTSILKWRSENKEHLREYNREYQRKLRKDPVKYQEMCMRINTRSYFNGNWKNSYKIISAVGMDRSQLANKLGMTEDQFKEMLKTCEIDHIVSASWFNNEKNIHLKPFMYRHYNLQFLPKNKNRSKHKWIDENDIRVQFVIKQLQLDYEHSKNQYNPENVSAIKKLSNEIVKLRTKIKQKYK